MHVKHNQNDCNIRARLNSCILSEYSTSTSDKIISLFYSEDDHHLPNQFCKIELGTLFFLINLHS